MELDHSGPITDCAFSPDNQYLAVADANRLVTLYGLPSYEVIYFRKLNKNMCQTFQSPTMYRNCIWELMLSSACINSLNAMEETSIDLVSIEAIQFTMLLDGNGVT